MADVLAGGTEVLTDGMTMIRPERREDQFPAQLTAFLLCRVQERLRLEAARSSLGDDSDSDEDDEDE